MKLIGISQLFPMMLLLSFIALVMNLGLADNCPTRCHCNRYKTFCFLARLETIAIELPLSTELLRVEHDNIKQINKSNVHAKNLPYLKTLQLVNVDLTFIEPMTFTGMNHLESLTISKNNMTELKSDTFTGLDMLYYLDLTQNGLVSLESGVFNGLNMLRHLFLSKNLITLIQSGMFQGLECGTRYSFQGTTNKLVIFANPIKLIDTNTFQGLCRFTHLKLYSYASLDLSPDCFQGLSSVTKLIMLNQCSITRNSNITKESLQGLPNLVNLHIQFCRRDLLLKGMFQENTLLKYLTISSSYIKDIQQETFRNLTVLKKLDLTSNDLKFLHNNSFQELQSLIELEFERNFIEDIEIYAFKGLLELRYLGLFRNNLKALREKVFFELKNLKKLDIRANRIHSLEPRVFTRLRSLKTLVTSNLDPAIFPKNSIVHFFRLSRLDELEILGRISTQHTLQVLKSLYIQASVTPFQLKEILRNINFLNDLKLRLYDLHSVTDVQKYSDFKISSLELIKNNFPVLYRNTFLGFRTVKSLSLAGCNITEIEPYAFYQMDELRELNLTANGMKILQSNSFAGLRNLKLLDLSNILVPKISFGAFNNLINLRTLYLHRNPIRYFHPDIFRELIQLKELYLYHNNLVDLPQGIFRNLLSIEKLDLHNNELHRLMPGTFGAICDDFTITCANLTQLTHYCNTTYALKTLRYLDLSANSIRYIHPHTFLSCTNLEVLFLHGNIALTLNNDYLYLPNLRNLIMFSCNITEISNTTFQCTTNLKKLYLDQNKIEKLRVGYFQHLSELTNIWLTRNPITYDCGTFATWFWFQNNHVIYKFDENFTDSILTLLNCNKTALQKPEKEMNQDEYHYFRRYIEPIVFIVIFVSGLFGNGVLLFINLRYPEMRTRQNVPITHLAVVDILCLTLNLPLSYWDVLHNSWDLGITTCKLFLTAKDMIVGVFIYSVVILSYERFHVVRISYYLKRLCGTSVSSETIFHLVLAWIFASISSTPIYFTANVHVRCLYSSIEHSTFLQRVWTNQFIVYCIIPTISIIFLNGTAAYILKKSVREMPGEKINNIQSKNRTSISNMVVIFSVVFAISYFPNYLLRVLVSWSVYVPEDIFLTSFISFCLFFCNSIISPIIFLTMNPKYKSYLLRFIRNTKSDNIKNKFPEIVVEGGKCEKDLSNPIPVSEDELARRARMERLAKLQKRFM